MEQPIGRWSFLTSRAAGSLWALRTSQAVATRCDQTPASLSRESQLYLDNWLADDLKRCLAPRLLNLD